MPKPHVVILGAGPAGLGAAYRLTRLDLAQATVLEARNEVGGNAGSFELAGLPVDYGSHRLHPSCSPEVLADIRALLGNDLLDRPRHGRIRLRGRWIHFPLKPVDLALRLPPSFALGAASDMLLKALPGRRGPVARPTFASALEQGLGRTICRDFYFPYARKMWGVEPEQLSAEQAQRRVSASSPVKMVRKVLSAVPGFKRQGGGRFFYPRGGFGQICEAFAEGAVEAGANIQMSSRVQEVDVSSGPPAIVRYEKNGETRSVQGDLVWSTIPIPALARCLNPAPPDELLQAASSIDYRAMILIYLVLKQDQFTEYDAHYFPEPNVPITRLSEPKNYSGKHRSELTVLCAELPCSPHGAEWDMSDGELGTLVCRALDTAGIPVRAPVEQVITRRLRHAYPIYQRGYEAHFGQLDRWIDRTEGLLTFGRQGLFAHDNTHHALHMAYCAVDCLDSRGGFDQDRWHSFRRVFETHVVED